MSFFLTTKILNIPIFNKIYYGVVYNMIVGINEYKSCGQYKNKQTTFNQADIIKVLFK